jgi:hypothetical protein
LRSCSAWGITIDPKILNKKRKRLKQILSLNKRSC